MASGNAASAFTNLDPFMKSLELSVESDAGYRSSATGPTSSDTSTPSSIILKLPREIRNQIYKQTILEPYHLDNLPTDLEFDDGHFELGFQSYRDRTDHKWEYEGTPCQMYYRPYSLWAHSWRARVYGEEVGGTIRRSMQHPEPQIWWLNEQIGAEARAVYMENVLLDMRYKRCMEGLDVWIWSLSEDQVRGLRRAYVEMQSEGIADGPLAQDIRWNDIRDGSTCPDQNGFELRLRSTTSAPLFKLQISADQKSMSVYSCWKLRNEQRAVIEAEMVDLASSTDTGDIFDGLFLWSVMLKLKDAERKICDADGLNADEDDVVLQVEATMENTTWEKHDCRGKKTEALLVNSVNDEEVAAGQADDGYGSNGVAVGDVDEAGGVYSEEHDDVAGDAGEDPANNEALLYDADSGWGIGHQCFKHQYHLQEGEYIHLVARVAIPNNTREDMGKPTGYE